jgi:hypothetical protein
MTRRVLTLSVAALALLAVLVVLGRWEGRRASHGLLG